MITNKELNAVRLSATKKDYYQIWNELLEVAGKISDRWDPATTNESDPGLVLLKVLTAIADKLNYNIDVNTLEAFMPSAAQMESMRNLCEMMGYNIKYYQSAATEVNIKLNGDAKTKFTEGINEITLPMFSVISNQEKDVNYVTLEAKNFSATNTTQTIPVMEGQHVQCETINNNIVTIDMLDDNNRFYLPEHQIAENGIFIYRINDGIRSERWEKKESLHTEHFNNLIYKFGYDSKEARPYVQFPEDIGQIIEDGLEIHYIRTSGAAGNTAAFTLSTFDKPGDDDWKEFSPESDFAVTQLSAAMNGSNIESITDAYKNFKKTVGTFDTLVTCRDYMNKIYGLMETTNVPMVSNIIVSDIRDDINRSVTLCSFNDFGICYTEKAIKEEDKTLIDHFDLMFYPFSTVYGYNNRAEYMTSFVFNADNAAAIKRELDDTKSIAHKIKYPNDDEIALIKNYLKLDARIVTTQKVSMQEELSILDAIKTEIYKNFNLRKLDFGEEIPFDSILDVIENADPRIKNVVLNEPVLLTKFATVGGEEYEVGTVVPTDVTDSSITPRFIGKELYNKLTLRNILAGRLELFNYNNKFKHVLNESAAVKWVEEKLDVNGNIIEVIPHYYENTYPGGSSKIKQITSIEPVFTLGELKDKDNGQNNNGSSSSDSDTNSSIADKVLDIPKNYELGPNQEIKFRSPNFVTEVTYPAYVNYFLKLSDEHKQAISAIPAEFKTLYDFMKLKVKNEKTGKDEDGWTRLETFISTSSIKYNFNEIISKLEKTKNNNEEYWELLTSYETKYGAIYELSYSSTDSTKISGIKRRTSELAKSAKEGKYGYIKASDITALLFKNWLISQDSDLYRRGNSNLTRVPGYLVDANLYKYEPLTSSRGDSDYLKTWYVPTHLGQDADYGVLEKDVEYQLKDGEYLLINYTPSSSSQTEDGTTTYGEGDPISICYGAGCIIKPNFEMGDTQTLVNGKVKAFSKNKVDFRTCKKYGKYPSDSELGSINMIGLGADEQIEYRKVAAVVLGEKDEDDKNQETRKGYYLYWALNDIDKANEELENNGYSYILKDNEYFFIASSNKDAMSYYGSGTEISLSADHPKFFDGIDTSISLDDILTNGITGVPWVYRTFDETVGEKGDILTLTEYQYITLAEGDVLSSISLNETVQKPLSKWWQKVATATFNIGGEVKKLPKIDIVDHNKKTLGWEVQSLLVMQTNSDNAIKLMDGEQLILRGLDEYSTPTYTPNTREESENDNPEDYTDVIKGNSNNPVVIRSNYPISGAHESISTVIDEYTDSYGNQIANDFMISVSCEQPLGLHTHTKSPIYDEDNNSTGEYEYVYDHIDTSIVNLHNFGEHLTNIHFNKYKTPADYIEFNLNIPEDSYGLIMMYYAKSNDTNNTDGAYLTASNNLKIFNNVIDGLESWWSDKKINEKHYLRPGINIVKIDKADGNNINNIKIYANARMDHNIIFSDLDLVYSDDDINLDLLDYQRTSNLGQDYWANIARAEKVSIFNKKRAGANLVGEIIEYDKLKNTAIYHPEGVLNRFIKVNDNIIYYKNINPIENPRKLARDQLLTELNKMDPDHEFYYNCIPDNSVAIDINTSLLGTDDAENMSNPRIWYDSNNINNKFVVSEIDAIYMEDGIKIARSSKR